MWSVASIQSQKWRPRKLWASSPLELASSAACCLWFSPPDDMELVIQLPPLRIRIKLSTLYQSIYLPTNSSHSYVHNRLMRIKIIVSGPGYGPGQVSCGPN